MSSAPQPVTTTAGLTTQNYKRFEEALNSEALNGEALNSPHWGFGTIVGSRFYPASGVSLIALYRYYSPYFDNALGYAFSETSRLGDENGGYLGFEVTRLKHWRFVGYGDVFYFSGPKYGIPESNTLGYDALFETQYHSPITNNLSPITNYPWSLLLRFRARKKGDSTYSFRMQYDHQLGPWSIRTTADANLIPSHDNEITESRNNVTYGLSLAQDVALDLTPYTLHHTPLSLRLRLQGFDAREWSNRIYCYEPSPFLLFMASVDVPISASAGKSSRNSRSISEPPKPSMQSNGRHLIAAQSLARTSISSSVPLSKR